MKHKLIDTNTISNEEVTSLVQHFKQTNDGLSSVWYKREYIGEEREKVETEVVAKYGKGALIEKKEEELTTKKKTSRKSFTSPHLFSWLKLKNKVEKKQESNISEDLLSDTIECEYVESDEEIEEELQCGVLNILPMDCFTYMCLYLHPMHICTLQLVCKYLYKIAAQDYLWREIISEQQKCTISEREIKELQQSYTSQYIKAKHIKVNKEWIYQRMFKYAFVNKFFVRSKVDLIINKYLEKIKDAKRKHQIMQQIYVCNALHTPSVEAILQSILDHQVAMQ